MVMDERIGKALEVLFEDLKDLDPDKLPLVGHYTSYPVLESIIAKEEFWLSNPLLMNDFQEVRFIMLEGSAKVESSSRIKEMFNNEELHTAFLEHFKQLHHKFAAEHVLNIYVLCLTEHDQDDYDGRLSMWRGYGSNASGACIVFDAKKIPLDPTSPFLFVEMNYLSVEEQKAWLDDRIERFCKASEGVRFLESAPFYLAWYIFERISLFALLTKHKGFSEEREWRLIYLPNRDIDGKFSHMIDYWFGPNGPEPKLKIQLKKVPGFDEGTFSLATLVDRLILGPTNSSPLSRAMMHRVLDKHQQSSLKARVHGSSIPFRTTAKSG